MINRTTSNRTVAVVLTGALVLSSLLGACRTAPPPRQLDSLNQTLGQPDARRVKEAPGGEKYYRDARKYRRKARIYYEDGKLDLARHYAILGQLRYRTAEAIYRQYREKQRHEKYENKLEKLQPELAQIREQIASTRQAINRLKRQSTTGGGPVAEMEVTPDNVEQMLQHARRARQTANAVQASDYAKTTFGRADNQLKSAEALYKRAGESKEVLRLAHAAAKLFDKAHQKAAPKFQEAKRRKNPGYLIRAIQKKANQQLPPPMLEAEPDGVRIIVPALFDEDSSKLKNVQVGHLETALKLASEFPEFDIDIRGYAPYASNYTRRLTLSKSRARSVQQWLVSEGVSKQRLRIQGTSDKELKFEDSRRKNERAELLFRLNMKSSD